LCSGITKNLGICRVLREHQKVKFLFEFLGHLMSHDLTNLYQKLHYCHSKIGVILGKVKKITGVAKNPNDK
jgi:hypothetical protein